MSNKRLTAHVRLNTTDFEQKLRRISKSIDALNNAVGKQSSAYRAVNKALGENEKIVDRVKSKTNKTKQSTNQWERAVNAVNARLKQSKSLIQTISSKLSGLARTLIGVGTIRLAIQGADTLTGSQNKFNNIAARQFGDSAYVRDASGNITGYSQQALDFTQETMDKIYTSAQKTGMVYSDMLAAVSKTMTLAPDAFQGNIDNAIRFQEIMAESFVIGGASAQEMSTSMYQLTQALGSGILAGDELRSVREGAPLAYQAIEEFAQGVYNTNASLKELASQGMITSDIVVAAVMAMGDEMDQAFALAKYRFIDVWNRIKSAAQKAFSPVVEMLSDKLNEAMDNGLIQKAEAFFTKVANAVLIIFDAIDRFFNWVSRNWYWLKSVIITALIAIATYYVILAAISVASIVTQIIKWIALNTVIFVVITSILLLLLVFLLWKTGAIDTCQAIVLALTVVGAAIIIIGIITGNVVLLIIGAIVLLVGLIIHYLDYVLAGIYATASVIWNIWFTLCAAICKGVILPLAVAWDAFANGMSNLFVDPIAAIIRQFESLAVAILSLLETIANGIDAIFGSNLSAAVQGWAGKLSSYADSLVAKHGNGKYTQRSNVTQKVIDVIDSAQTGLIWDTSNAWNKGMEHGSIAKDYINNWGSKFQNGFGLFDSLTGQLNGLNVGGSSTPLNPNSAEELLNNLNNAAEDAAGGANKAADNTGKIADSMDLAEEDLRYLRKVAEMEWKKEFTTASIKVDMSNYNNINGESDLDGIVTKLADKLYEELNIVADGVYV